MLIFVNRFFYPDHSATSQMLTDLAFALAEQGESVTVVASRQRYLNAGARLSSRESVKGVDVHRVWTSRFGRAGLVGRAFDYLSFYLSAAWRLRRLARRGDVVIAMTDPPMLSVLVHWGLAGRRVRQVNWLQDLFPEVAAVLGVRLADGWFGQLLRHWRDASLRAAALNIVIGERMAERVRSLGAEQVQVIHNWADCEAIRPVAADTNRLRQEWGLADAFVVGYSGNLGRAHDYSTLLGAAELLGDQLDLPGSMSGGAGQRIVFIFIGDGHHLDGLRAEVARRGLDNLEFYPYQPRERLSESLGVADVHWISLRPALEGLIVPSKFYGIAAAGRPMLFVGDLDGEIGRLVRENDCGTLIAEGDAKGFAAAVCRLRDDSGLREGQGRRARGLAEERFDRELALWEWGEVLSFKF